MDPDGRASILARVINDVGGAYTVAHYAGKITGDKSLFHSLVDMGRLNSLETDGGVSHYSGDGIMVSEYTVNAEYVIYYSNMNDDIVNQAIENVEATGQFNSEEYRIFLNDCNDYTSAVYNEYKQLWMEDFKSNYTIENGWDNFIANISAAIAWTGHYYKITERSGEIVTIGGIDGETVTE